MTISVTDDGNGNLHIKCECGCERRYFIANADDEPTAPPAGTSNIGTSGGGQLFDGGNLTSWSTVPDTKSK